MMRKIFKLSRLKIIALTLAFTTVLVMTVRTSIAFFTDAKESTSVYTAGNVYIKLSEAAVATDSSGNLIEDAGAARIEGAEISENGETVLHNYGVVFPGQSIYKDPTIENVGKGDAWVAAKVIIEDGAGDIHRLYRYSDGYDDIDIEGLLSGGLLDEQVHVGVWNGIDDVCYNDRYAMIQSSSRLNGKYEFYFIMLSPMEKGETVTVFDTLQINPLFGNAEMLEFRDLKITVQAFAVQTFGFSSCFDAMTGAFSEHFSLPVSAP